MHLLTGLYMGVAVNYESYKRALYRELINNLFSNRALMAVVVNHASSKRALYGVINHASSKGALCGGCDDKSYIF